MLTLRIMTFLLMLPSGNENSEHKSNSIPQPLYTYLSGSAFLVNSPPQNKLFLPVNLNLINMYLINKQ